MPSQEEVERFIDNFTRNWKDVVPENFAELWHDDGRLLHPGMSEPIAKERIPAHVRQIKAALPDIQIKPTCWAVNGDVLFIEVELSATVRGESVSWNGVDRFILRGDRAVSGVAYLNTLGILQQIQPDLEIPKLADLRGLDQGA